MRIGDITSTPDKSFDISVYDLAVMEFPDDGSISLKIKALPLKTVYTVRETIFDLNGIKVEIKIPSVFGDRALDLPATRFEVITEESYAPGTEKAGSTAVYVGAHDTDGMLLKNSDNSYVADSYNIDVVYPFVGTSWYIVNDSNYGMPSELIFMLSFTSNTEGLIYESEKMDDFEKYDYTVSYVDGSYKIIFDYGYKEETFTFNEQGLSHYDDDELMAKKQSEDCVISSVLFILNQGDRYLKFIALNGKLSEEIIKMYSGQGSFYLTNEFTDNKVVTAETLFSSDTAVYWKYNYNSPDYSSEAFIGLYMNELTLLEIKENYFTLNGYGFYYTAEKTENGWTIFDDSDKPALYYVSASDTITFGEAQYERFDENKYVLVNLYEIYQGKEYDYGLYVVGKGESLGNMYVIKDYHSLTSYYTIIKFFEFESYNGESINENLRIQLADSNRVMSDSFEEGKVYGNFNLNFEFDIYNLAVIMNEKKVETVGTFTGTYQNRTFYMTFTFGERVFNAELKTSATNPDFMTVTSGVYADTDCALNVVDFYEGADLINEFKNADSNIIKLQKDGTYTMSQSQGGGNYIVTANDDGIYTIIFTDSAGQTTTAAYDSGIRRLTYNSVFYDAPALYAGRFSYRGEVLNLENGSFTINNVKAGTYSLDKLGAIEIKLTLNDSSSVSLTYTVANDSLIYNGTKYSRYSPIYKGYDFVTMWFYLGDTFLKIDAEGNVILGGNIIGITTSIEKYSEDKYMNIYFDYYDGSYTDVLAVFDYEDYLDTTITIGSSVYTSRAYIPFAGTYKDAQGNKRILDNNGKLYDSKHDSIAYISEYDEVLQTITLRDNYYNLLYGSYNATSITIDGVVYTAYIPEFANTPFVDKYYWDPSEYDSFRILEDGEVAFQGFIVGMASDLDENALTFWIDYTDPAKQDVTATYSADGKTLTINGIVYTDTSA